MRYCFIGVVRPGSSRPNHNLIQVSSLHLNVYTFQDSIITAGVNVRDLLAPAIQPCASACEHHLEEKKRRPNRDPHQPDGTPAVPRSYPANKAGQWLKQRTSHKNQCSALHQPPELRCSVLQCLVTPAHADFAAFPIGQFRLGERLSAIDCDAAGRLATTFLTFLNFRGGHSNSSFSRSSLQPTHLPDFLPSLVANPPWLPVRPSEGRFPRRERSYTPNPGYYGRPSRQPSSRNKSPTTTTTTTQYPNMPFPILRVLPTSASRPSPRPRRESALLVFSPALPSRMIA